MTGSSPVGGSRKLVEGIRMKTAVFTSFDENYAEYALVMVKTFSENYHGEPIDFYCLVPENVVQFEKLYIDTCKNHDNVKIKFFTASKQKELESKITDEHISISYITTECFHRIFIADSFPEIDIAIYIDPDAIILRDIQSLLDYPLPGAISARSEAPNSKRTITKNSDWVYFNNGVYKTNLNFWRQHDLANKMLNHVELNGITRYPEQDLMNIFLSDQVSELSINFNYPSWFDSIGFFRDTVVNPAIVHFVGPTKPWKKHSIEKKWSSLWRAKYKEIFGNSIEDSDQFSKPYPYDTNAT